MTLQSLTAERRRLSNALRRARDDAGMTQEDVARAMDWSLSKLIRIENGAVGLSTSDLRQLLQLYAVDHPDRVGELVELARAGRQRPWWMRYRDMIPSPYLTYIGLEAESRALRYCYPYSMPGLLQTEEYAHVIAGAMVAPVHNRHMGITGFRLASKEVETSVEVKMTRQEKVLGRTSPPEITAILDEGTLHRQMGGAAVLQRQLRHLLELGGRGHISIRVIPFTAQLATVLSPFAILEFPDPDDADAVYIESALELGVLDQVEEVAIYREGFVHLQAAALPEDASRDLIAHIASGLS